MPERSAAYHGYQGPRTTVHNHSCAGDWCQFNMLSNESRVAGAGLLPRTRAAGASGALSTQNTAGYGEIVHSRVFCLIRTRSAGIARRDMVLPT